MKPRHKTTAPAKIVKVGNSEYTVDEVCFDAPEPEDAKENDTPTGEVVYWLNANVSQN